MAAYPSANLASSGFGVPPMSTVAAPAGLTPSPPGLWQPPGLGSVDGLPPAVVAQPPSVTTPDLVTATATAPGLGTAKEISGTIESQVMKLIEQARHDTESKVKVELKQIRDAMMVLDQQLDQLLAQLDAIEPREPREPSLDAEAVSRLQKIEQQWGQEIKTLKQELHQTILAHNHNSDLMKHHKETIEVLRERCGKLQSSNVKTSGIQQQLIQLDARLKQQQNHRKLEPLFERVAAVEQRLAAAATQNAAWPYRAMPPVGMMPPGLGAAGSMMQGKGAAYKCPTDEEVQL